jgi:predicted DNA-binding protein with PD1-like motif
MIAPGARAGAIVVLRLAYGDLLLESLQDICRREKIRNGVILTGFGSLTDHAVTGVVGPAFPPRRFYRREKPRGVEIIAMSGVIADYHVHCHIVLCDRRGAFGGHLERGCRVLSLAEIALMRVDGIKLARRLDPTTGQKLLQSVTRYATGNGGPDQEGSLVTVERRLSRREASRRPRAPKTLPEPLRGAARVPRGAPSVGGAWGARG